MKNDEVLTKAFIKVFNEIFDESYMILDNFSNEIEVDQKIIFSLKNIITAKKIIFILIVIIQII